MSVISNLSRDQLVDDKTAGEFLSVKISTLSVWRTRRNVGLPYVKLGKNVRYRVGDLIDYIAAQTQGKAA
jgi:hypothetical protein